MTLKPFFLASIFAAVCAVSVPAQVTAGGPVVIPIAPGSVKITISYPQPDGTIGTLALSLVVSQVPIASLQFINALNPPRWTDSATVNKKFCLIAWAKDSAGNTLVGRSYGFTTNDSTIAKMARDPVCPTLTVDPAKMTSLPVPPQL